MKKLLQTTLLGVGLLISAVSCVMEESVKPGPASESSKQIVFKVQMPDDFAVASTRALTQSQEKKVSEVDVLVFNELNSLVTVSHAISVKQEGNVSHFSAFVPPTVNEDQVYTFVVLANASTAVRRALGEDPSALPLSHKTYDKVCEVLTTTITGALYLNGGTIPMWGEERGVVVTSELQEIRVRLTRAVARIDIGVGDQPNYNPAAEYPWSWDGFNDRGQRIPFELTEVYVARPNNIVSLLPALENLDTSTVVAPTINADTEMFSAVDSWTKFRYNVSNGLFTTQTIYVPEVKLSDGVRNDSNHAERMALVVGGKYNNSEATSYYRVDFVENGRLVDILRNHLYRFSITTVRDSGQNTPRGAYEAESSMMAEMIDWQDGLMSEIRWGQEDYLAVSKNPAELQAESGSSLVVRMLTNISSFQMSLGSGVAASLSSTEALAAGPAGQTFSTMYFNYTLRKEAGADEYSLTIETRTDNISVTQGSQPTDRWTINANGRIQMPFHVTQLWHAPVTP